MTRKLKYQLLVPWLPRTLSRPLGRPSGREVYNIAIYGAMGFLTRIRSNMRETGSMTALTSFRRSATDLMEHLSQGRNQFTAASRNITPSGSRPLECVLPRFGAGSFSLHRGTLTEKWLFERGASDQLMSVLKATGRPDPCKKDISPGSFRYSKWFGYLGLPWYSRSLWWHEKPCNEGIIYLGRISDAIKDCFFSALFSSRS